MKWLGLGGGAAMVLVSPLMAVGAQQPAAGNAAAGARQFLQCSSCHSVERGEAHDVGPNLWGIMISKAGSRPGFAYSPAMKNARLTWTVQEMDAFLARPNARVP